MLDTFVIVNDNKIISPNLVTVRCYGKWFEEEFDKYTVNLELYMKSVKKGGQSVLEWHPGTRIGEWFNKTKVNSSQLKCWYIPQHSKVMDKLVQHNYAETRDTCLINKQPYLRVYTVDQILLYIKTNIAKGFHLDSFIQSPLQIKVSDSELNNIKIPAMVQKQKTLLF